ncbi:MAG: patatin-like phospholipase RssA [Gammaproteobacteria bacterium]|nr:patatin-like phospholipase RssA [Gammaproteobacteria bacterium]MCW8987447.1 patatin-like phospholipase RssA [Gammaproteobacteria bacterium]MCW9030996.1 patatin-like phospholipase RssA [Gammaproteobacteria bacterium]
MATESSYHPKIGLALGSGSARGWAHIGVIQALLKLGIKPDIVAGTSIGAIVGAAYASNKIDQLEEMAYSITWKEILNFFDFTVIGGGFIQGDRLFNFFRRHVEEDDIESLPHRFAAVATELETGREIWFQEGSLLKAVRASIALPGIFTPIKVNGRWLVDGGLSNPVPVSLCRAMGADIVIAVNLNGDIVGKHTRKNNHQKTTLDKTSNNNEKNLLNRITAQISTSFQEQKNIILSRLFGDDLDSPGVLEVTASSINIMQDRLTRSRMAGDPPDIVLSPQLSHLGLMEFDQAKVAIEEGRASVERMRPALEKLLTQ